MLNDDYEGDGLTFEYFESINFYRPIKTYFKDNLIILAVNSFIISSDLVHLFTAPLDTGSLLILLLLPFVPGSI
jgi:hypothetical protein